MENNGMLLKNLANELEDLIFTLNPDRTTPIYGDISDHLARQRDNAMLPVGFDTYKYMQDLCKLARQAAKEIMAFAQDLKFTPAETMPKIAGYFRTEDNSVTIALTAFKGLVDMLPDSSRASVNELDPFKRAAFVLNNTLKVIQNIISEIHDEYSVDIPDSSPVGAVTTSKLPNASVSESIMKKDENEERYLERLYTTAELIITTNLSPALRKKYIHVELFESKYSFIKKNDAYESELRGNIKQFTIKSPGAFPYITLVVFVKEFANMILMTSLSYDGKNTSAEFFERYYTLKFKTRSLMERILGMPKVDLAGSEALAFIRKEIVPLSNAWVKDIIIPMRLGKMPYYDEINRMSQFITNRINKIYALEGIQ